MADLENRVDKLETKTNELDNKVNVLAQKVDDFIAEMRDFKTEMRDRDNRRAAEIAELRQQHNADMKELRDEIKNSFKHVQIVTITSIIGIVTIAATFISFTLSNKDDTPAPVQTPPAATAQLQISENAE